MLTVRRHPHGSQAVTRKARILDVVYNASNNELVRTQTLVKNAIVQVDATPFKQWYSQHYNVELGAKKDNPELVPKPEEIKASPGQSGATLPGQAARGLLPVLRQGANGLYYSSSKCFGSHSETTHGVPPRRGCERYGTGQDLCS